MLNAFPGHVSDVQQAVNAAQINECTVVSEVLNDTFNFHAFLQVFQQLIALCAVFGFDNGTTRNNNVVALLIQLDYFKFKLFAFGAECHAPDERLPENLAGTHEYRSAQQ